MKKILSAVMILLLLGLCACARTPKDEVTGITINADNAKYWYLSGQEIDPTGLVITATLSLKKQYPPMCSSENRNSGKAHATSSKSS